MIRLFNLANGILLNISMLLEPQCDKVWPLVLIVNIIIPISRILSTKSIEK